MLETGEHINLETALHKIVCGTHDGRIGELQAAAWQQSRRIDFTYAEGHMLALGKEMMLREQRLRDTTHTVEFHNCTYSISILLWYVQVLLGTRVYK
eukprot:SAG11_NODE_1713_length_4398_cov_5.942080_4_plen_97_part_00